MTSGGGLPPYLLYTCVHARYGAPETTGSVLRLHRGPLGFVAKVWDHLGPVFTSDHRFSGGRDGSEISVGAKKQEFPKIQSRLANGWKVVPPDGYWSKSSQTMTKLHSRFRIPPLTSKIMVQKSALELKKCETLHF